MPTGNPAWKCAGCCACCTSHHSLEYVLFPATMRDEIASLIAGQDVGKGKKYGILQHGDDGILLALHGIGTPCIFLANGLCSIWERRPTICREYPQRALAESERSQKYWATRCPTLKGILSGD
jgi:Fe-S-cluster containining protein